MGDSFCSIGHLYRVGWSTVKAIVAETCQAIWDVIMPLVMAIPDATGWLKITEQFNNCWNFPNCVGALDGKHCMIQAPPP